MSRNPLPVMYINKVRLRVPRFDSPGFDHYVNDIGFVLFARNVDRLNPYIEEYNQDNNGWARIETEKYDEVVDDFIRCGTLIDRPTIEQCWVRFLKEKHSQFRIESDPEKKIYRGDVRLEERLQTLFQGMLQEKKKTKAGLELRNRLFNNKCSFALGNFLDPFSTIFTAACKEIQGDDQNIWNVNSYGLIIEKILTSEESKFELHGDGDQNTAILYQSITKMYQSDTRLLEIEQEQLFLEAAIKHPYSVQNQILLEAPARLQELEQEQKIFQSGTRQATGRLAVRTNRNFKAQKAPYQPLESITSLFPPYQATEPYQSSVHQLQYRPKPATPSVQMKLDDEDNTNCTVASDTV